MSLSRFTLDLSYTACCSWPRCIWPGALNLESLQRDPLLFLMRHQVTDIPPDHLLTGLIPAQSNRDRITSHFVNLRAAFQGSPQQAFF